MRYNPAAAKLMADLRPTAKDLCPNEPSVHDWEYRGIPGRLSLELWDDMLAIIGAGNYRVVAMSGGRDTWGSWWRSGQLLISPDGMRRLSEHTRGGTP